LTLDNSDILELLERLDRESKALKEELLNICWFMRGSISYDEAMMLSSDDRELIAKIIKRNMETTKESGMPFF
jgi:signal transduction histidine kinase